jgi:Flp pilus assembly protein TadG
MAGSVPGLRSSLRSRRRDTGQVLVIFALAIVVLFAAAGLAFDIGRFYAERRFLQNAADAGALAAANALIRGETVAEADAQARDVLARNFLSSPNGSNPQLPPTTPVYEIGHAGDASYLVNGILISGGEVRVAVQSDVGYTFGRVVGFTTNTIGGRAKVRTIGDLLPIAVRHYINAPGTMGGGTYPCDGDPNDFQDLIATADTACLDSETFAANRSAPSSGTPYNSAVSGPIISLVGDDAKPSNLSSFRGFVALDIRNFQSSTSNVFYNEVTAGTQPNVLKDMEAGWVATGYFGPDFPPATTPPDPNDQIGIMDGNTTGSIIDAIDDRYGPGDEVLAAVYSGTVMTIPDFSFTVPSTVSIGTTQNRNNAITMTVTKNNAFAGVVDTTAFANWGDPTNPYGTSLAPLTFSPLPATPNTTITWTTFTTTAAPAGVYTVWVKGHSSSPYLTDHYYPVAINIGGVGRDFTSNGSGLVLSAATTGSTATGTMSFSTPNNGSTFFGGDVTLTIEGGPQANGVLPSGLGATSITPSTFTLNKAANQTVTLSVNGGTLGPGEYPLTVRATGTNQAGQVVTRLIPFTLDIATAGTASEYVDIMGFTVFRLTCTPSASSCPANRVEGYAISGVYADMNDQALQRGQTARLVPWD